MDILFFFKERVAFIRWFYEEASAVFVERMSKIEKGEPPWDDPPYQESDEPSFLPEFIEADEAREVLGLTCISMLSALLHMYLVKWERDLGVKWESGERKQLFREGGLEGYVNEMERMLGAPHGQCPADLELLEQVTLARNAVQHPEDLTGPLPKHRKADLGRYPRPFFMNDLESVYLEGDLGEVPFLVPHIRVSREKLHRAIEEAGEFAAWLDDHLQARRAAQWA